MQNLISIIVPVYKVEEIYFRQSISSILSQTYVNWECILIDDGSPDACGKICDEFASKSSKIKVLHTENRGVSAARNAGLRIAKGKYITFIDSDDYVSPQYLEHLYTAIQTDKTDCSMCGCKYVKGVGTIALREKYKTKIRSQGQILDDLFYMHHPFKNIEMTAVWGTMYSSACLQEVQFNEALDIGEDFVFKLDAFQKIKEITYIETQDYGYLIRNDSAMRKRFDDKRIQTFYGIRALTEKYSSASVKLYKGVLSRCVNIAIVLYLSIPKQNMFLEEKQEIVDFIKKSRFKVLLNHKTRVKVKFALLSSYFGFGVMRKLFEIVT